MRFLTLFIFLISTTFSAFGQILEPVKWTMEQKQVNGDEFELIFKAKIDDGWKVYSQYLESDDGPIRTSFNFDKGEHFELVGKTEESETNRKKMFDEVFKMNLITLTKEGVFTQKVKVKDYKKPITGYLEFMCCDATRCLPPSEVDFDFALKATGAVENESPKIEEVKTTVPAAEESKVVEQVKETVPAVTIPKVVLPTEPENKIESTKKATQMSSPNFI